MKCLVLELPAVMHELMNAGMWAASHKKVLNVLRHCHIKRRVDAWPHPSFFWYDTDFLDFFWGGKEKFIFIFSFGNPGVFIETLLYSHSICTSSHTHFYPHPPHPTPISTHTNLLPHSPSKNLKKKWNRRFSRKRVNNMEALRETIWPDALQGKSRVPCDALKARYYK